MVRSKTFQPEWSTFYGGNLSLLTVTCQNTGSAMMPNRTVRSTLGLLGSALFLGVTLFAPSAVGSPPAPQRGSDIFRARCAVCHGPNGEGGVAYPRALTGKKSVAELSRFIQQEMPPGPKHCSKEEANLLAPFLFNSFYSPLAQERFRPAQVSLQRLTVRQFRNAVADLVSVPHQAVPNDPPTGLYGEYFNGRDTNAKTKVFKRIDPEINFDFGTSAPAADKFDPHIFTIAWQGDVLAPDTGDYEFTIRSDQSVRLWVNGWKQPLIDGHIRSSNDNEFTASIYLVGGRAYPIRLEFIKAGQGVDDSNQRKAKPPGKAFVSLLWRRPQHATERIPSHCFFTQTDVPTFIVDTKFPPDDRSTGYERGSSVSKEWDDATTAAAISTANYIVSNLADVTGVPQDAPDRKERLRKYCERFVQRAFRRPNNSEVQRIYVDKQFDSAANPEIAVKRSVILTLISPRFLYREIVAPGTHDPYAIASQLSFGLWDTLPDAEITRAAAAGELASPENLKNQASRMAADPKAWNKLREFLFHWLRLDDVPDIVKNPVHYPGFDVASVSDLRTSLEIFLEKTAWNDRSDYRDLMLSNTTFLNGRLAKIYGVNLPTDAPFQPFALDSAERSGVLTNPYLLSRFAYLDASSPIHRGVLIVRNFLGRVLQPPPAAFAPLAPGLHPDFTTRERVAFQTKPDFCNACHGVINPLGFTLERFDAIGRLRDKDNGKPIDCTGSYVSKNGMFTKFSGANDLAKFLATDEEAHAAFVEKLFQHLIKQPVLAYGPTTLNELNAKFVENRYSIRRLMADIVLSTITKSSGKQVAR